MTLFTHTQNPQKSKQKRSIKPKGILKLNFQLRRGRDRACFPSQIAHHNGNQRSKPGRGLGLTQDIIMVKSLLSHPCSLRGTHTPGAKGMERAEGRRRLGQLQFSHSVTGREGRGGLHTTFTRTSVWAQARTPHRTTV